MLLSEQLDTLLQAAQAQGASDIHFEPSETHYRIRIRLDGLLQTFAELPITQAPRFSTRIKVLAQLDIAEKRLPQEGRFWLERPPHSKIDCRVSSCPTLFGEKMVIRFLDPQMTLWPLNTLGLDAEQEQLFRSALQQPEGLILVTGPTGSGKTVSLYAALHHLNQAQTNILTIEDPVEMQISGLNQVQVHTAIGLTFEAALQAFLRQDPDVIMIGEIRTLQTAKLALQAAQTGHLVLATLHTNSALETLSRLENLGLERYQLISSLRLIIAQRLLRCTHPQKGYAGRTGIFELLPPPFEHPPIKTLRHSALEKIAAGLSDHAEMIRVLGD